MILFCILSLRELQKPVGVWSYSSYYFVFPRIQINHSTFITALRVEILISFRIPLQKSAHIVFAKLQRAALWMQLLFLFFLVNVQKTNINIWLHTLSFSIFKSENNLQYNFHINHVLTLFVCNFCIIKVNRQSRREKFITLNFVSVLWTVL